MAAIGMPTPSMPPAGPPPLPAASIRVSSPSGMQTQSQQTTFTSPNHPSQSVSGLSLALPLSSSSSHQQQQHQGAVAQTGPASHAMPGGISQHPGMSHAISGVMLGPVTHAMPLSTAGYPYPIDTGCGLPRTKLVDILPEDGPPSAVYTRAVEELSNSLARYGAAVIELSQEDASRVKCALESASFYFSTKSQSSVSGPWSGAGWSKTAGYVPSATRDMYYYRAGRNPRTEEVEQPPPCMSEVFRCLGKASRVALGAISRHLRLRSDAFYSLLDDCPLPDDNTSSSILVATHFHDSGANAKVSNGIDGCLQEYEKGLLTLIASDSPGLQVCDANGNWYLADMNLQPGEVLLITGRSLQHVTAGICHACAYRVAPLPSPSGPGSSGRTSLTFRLMPRSTETLDGSAMADAGYAVSERFGPVLVAKFMESLHVTDGIPGNRVESPVDANKGLAKSEPSLRALLSDPVTGEILEDAFTSLNCGHSFGGGTLKKVTETQRCATCSSAVNIHRMIPNHALRAAAAAFKREESRKQQAIASRKRRKEFGEHGEHGEKIKRLKELPGSPTNFDGARHLKGVQYPFNVNEKVLIKGNKRTPEKFVGREAIVTSKCLNGWYLLKTLDSGESVRLQYRSLQATVPDGNGVNDQTIQQQNAGEINSVSTT